MLNVKANEKVEEISIIFDKYLITIKHKKILQIKTTQEKKMGKRYKWVTEKKSKWYLSVENNQ